MGQLWEGINQYLADRAPKEWEKAEVRRYRQRLHDIFNAKYRLMSFYQSGSFQHGTAITPHSDVDYVARIHFEDRPVSSTTVLNNVRQLLKDELYEAISVSVSRPTVTVQFPGLVTRYEITPAYLIRGTSDDDRVVSIPAAGGGWREAAPKAHNKFVADVDRQRNGNVRELARLLKAWKYEHGVPISSFYLEMRCAEHGKNNDFIWSLSSLKAIVNRLITTNLAAMNDPTGLVSRISPCSAESSRLTSMARLRDLHKNLDAAYTAWAAGESRRWEMNQALRAIWGTSFPYCDPYSA
ncbi:nucleotidyltransferase domain-containing protein [Pseudarthrobacter raffinosi]|uniref:nucleotidyltransferase domain-containing protein n=1 Tax=Pseudarthrobacter raffinosi TaxID=2953651 RepID=UPI00208ECB8F|nr:nucleotidyltransferase [Pseudarthrobacter sp. MDT3-28]MCO4239813.1 nucleotidyltransferase [Pseudarthrobacter sp. MDT3-28]